MRQSLILQNVHFNRKVVIKRDIEKNGLTKPFVRCKKMVDVIVRNLNFSILNQLSKPVKKISA